MDDGGTDVRGEDRLIDWRLDELYERHARWATQLAYLLTGDLDAAAELAQCSFVRVFGRFRDLREPFAFDAHLRRAVVSLARDRDRHRKGAARVDGDDPVWSAVRSLPWSQRVVIVLRYGDDLSTDESAQVLGVPRSRARSWEVAGMGALRAGTLASDDTEDLVRRRLHDHLRDVRVPLHLGEGTRARSRRRRNLSAAAIALASAIALFTLVVAMQSLRGFSGGPPPSPMPTSVDDPDAWRGIFPQTTRQAAEREQRAADEGDPASELQRDPDRVAADFAAEVLGWTSSVRELDGGDSAPRGPLVTAVFSCSPMAGAACEEPSMRVDLTLERPFVEGPRGIWVVTEASDPVPVEPLPAGVPSSFVAVRGTAVVRASTLTGHTLATLARFPANVSVQTITTDPRGRRVVIGLVAGDTSTIVIVPADGSNPPRVVVHGGFPALDPGGRRLAYVMASPGPSRLVVRDLETGRERAWPAAAVDRGESLGRIAWLDERRLVVTFGSGSEPPTLRVLALDSTTPTVQEATTPPPPARSDAWWTPIGTWGGRPVLELTCCGSNASSRSLVIADPDSWTVVGTAADDLPCCVPAVEDRPGPILMSGLAGAMFWIDAQGVRHGIGDGFAGPSAAWLEAAATG